MEISQGLIDRYAVFFRDQLRYARNRAIDDAENFDELLYAFERLGCFLLSDLQNLGKYKNKLLRLAGHSCLARKVPQQWHEWHLRAEKLLEIVRKGRNDALHHGAFARHLTTRAIELAIILEDALMNGFEKVGDYMVRDPICASLWHPISFIRQQMLAHSFSYLPVYVEAESTWRLVSDLLLATYLRSPAANDRNTRLAKSLQEAITQDGLQLVAAQCYHADQPINDVIDILNGLPILICRKEHPTDLIGILTPFDLL